MRRTLPAGLIKQSEWVLRRPSEKPPAQPPRLNEVVRLVAMCGGFLGRKGDKETGIQTIGRACRA